MNLKQTLIAAAASSLLGGASFVVASSFRSSSDDLFMANVEALADGEWTPPTVPCAYAPRFYCPIVVVNDEEKYEFFSLQDNIPTWDY